MPDTAVVNDAIFEGALIDVDPAVDGLCFRANLPAVSERISLSCRDEWVFPIEMVAIQTYGPPEAPATAVTFLVGPNPFEVTSVEEAGTPIAWHQEGQGLLVDGTPYHNILRIEFSTLGRDGHCEFGPAREACRLG